MEFKPGVLILSVVGILLVTLYGYSRDAGSNRVSYEQKEYKLVPDTFAELPAFPSPFTTGNGMEIVISSTKNGEYTLIPVTLINSPDKWNQLEVDREDFPTLAKTGLHSDKELADCKKITGRSIEAITKLGYPGLPPENLSYYGFMAKDEDIISVLRCDNQLVRELGLTHPQLAKPLFHTYNLVLKAKEAGIYLSENRHVTLHPYFLYNGKRIFVKVTWTKGGQESIFKDDLEGALDIHIWRDADPDENKFLEAKYGNIAPEQKKDLIKKLSYMFTGELEPYYVKRYGFYEGHTNWRVDPLAIAFIFGLKSIEEIEKLFPGKIYKILTDHFNGENPLLAAQ